MRLLLFLLLMPLGCVAHRSREPAAPLPEALRLDYRTLMVSAIGMNCLSRHGDTTFFRVALVLDSLPTSPQGAVAIIRQARPRDTSYPNVSAHFSRAGTTRVQGTGCWQDSGVAFRAPAHIVDDAAVFLDAAGRVEISLYDDSGRAIAPIQTLSPERGGTRVEWTAPATLKRTGR